MQFLEYNLYRNNIESLTREVLSEVPRQFSAYMENNKILPYKTKSKNNKAASSEFVHTKIEEVRKLSVTVTPQRVPHFLK